MGAALHPRTRSWRPAPSRHAAPGRIALSQGDPATVVAMVGRPAAHPALGETRSLSIGYRGAGDVIGEAAVGGASAYRESAVATEDVEALLVPVGTVRALIAADQAFGSAFVAMLVDRHGDTEERLASMLFRNVEARLAEFLVKAAARWGIPEPRGVLIAAPFTRRDGQHDRIDPRDGHVDLGICARRA
jgi:CRP-like cAMP-binding protein